MRRVAVACKGWWTVDGRDRLSLLSGVKKSPLEGSTQSQATFADDGISCPNGQGGGKAGATKKNAMGQLLTEKRCISNKGIQPVASVNVWSA